MKHLVYHSCAGINIERACAEAISLAARRNRPVRFKFNDVNLRVHKRLSTRHVVRQWKEMQSARSRRYFKSEEGRAAECVRAARRARNQDAVTTAISTLPGLVQGNNLDHLIGWLHSFAHHANAASVDFDAAAGLRRGGLEWICLLFESKGYRDGDGVGQDPDWFCTRARLGRYIIGQAINCMRKGLPPHPGATERFCSQYFALPDAAVQCGQTPAAIPETAGLAGTPA